MQHSTILKHISHSIQMASILVVGVFLVLSAFSTSANAVDIPNRSIAVSSSAANALVQHTIKFDVQSTTSVGSIVFEYCENSPLPAVVCIPPQNFDVGTSSLIYQFGETGFSYHPNTVPNRLVMTRFSAVTSAGSTEYRLANVHSPSGPLGTHYLRISTYASTDGTGSVTDFGAVTFSVLVPLTVQVYVPPYLILCTGITVAIDCSSSNGFGIDLGELSKVAANAGASQFSVATNSFTGYVASIQGTTMTAGNRTIPRIIAPSSSQPGTSQFGINLRQNNVPSVGKDIEGIGTGSVASNYAIQNQFVFQSGDQVASSLLSTEWNRYTISYLINVANGQTAGRYAATLTVIATTTF